VAAALFVRVFLARAEAEIRNCAELSCVDLLKAGLFAALVMGYVIVVNRTFDGEAEESLRGVPLLVVIMGVIAVLMSYVSTNTRLGRYAYAIAATGSGAAFRINIRKTILTIYVIMGALMGVSGIALAAYVARAPLARRGLRADVIASCILAEPRRWEARERCSRHRRSPHHPVSLQRLADDERELERAVPHQGLVLILAVLADISMKKKRA